MSFLKRFIKSSDPTEEISKILPISDCSATCLSTECFTKYPSSFKLDPADLNSPLWETTKPYDLHVLISTGETNWQHDATDISGSVLKKISSWSSSKTALDHFSPKSNGIKVNVSSLPLPIDSNKYMDYKKRLICDVLLLPFFIWCKGLTIENHENVLNTLLPILIKKRDSNDDSIEIPKQIGDVIIEKDESMAYVMLCSHKTRDKRCGITAPIMKKEFDLHLRELDLYRDISDNRPKGVNVIFINHVGGHKFSANVLINLRSGEDIWYAKCSPLNVKPIIDETILNHGKVFPEYVRIVQKYKPINW